MKLDGKAAVITGAGSGIGRASALLFAQEGARVAVVDYDGAAAEEVVGEIRANGGHAMVQICDVGAGGAAGAAVAAISAHWPDLTILMTAAGFSVGGTVLTTSDADWDAVFNANVNGTWRFARAAIPLMQAQGGGSIITVASQLALAGGRGNSAYIASKGAILSLTRTMALDFAGDNIRVNAIVPGAIDTPLLARGFARRSDPAAAREASRQRHAMRRFGTASEVAQAALYLASDAASYSTGTTMVVDGGWLAQ